MRLEIHAACTVTAQGFSVYKMGLSETRKNLCFSLVAVNRENWIKEMMDFFFPSVWWIGASGNNNLSSLQASHSCTYPPYTPWTHTLWFFHFSFSSTFPRSLSFVPFVYSGSWFLFQAAFPEGEASEDDMMVFVEVDGDVGELIALQLENICRAMISPHIPLQVSTRNGFMNHILINSLLSIKEGTIS